MHASFWVEAKLRAFLRTEAPQASSGFFGLLRAWIARGAVWCPPQARHGLSITHLSAGCQGFEALSKACSCSEQRAKTVWKMFAQIHTRTAPREAQRDCTTPRLIGFDIGLSLAASAPRMDPNTSVCGCDGVGGETEKTERPASRGGPFQALLR